MKHILENFRPESGYHCITTSYKQALHYLGVDISEEMLFGLGSALNFFYGDYKVFPFPMISGRINIGKYEEYLTENSGIMTTVHETTSIKRARTTLYNLIVHDIPVPVYVDMVYLDYLKLPEDAHFGGHTILVFGIDENEGIAYISDRDGKGFKVTNNPEAIPSDFHKLSLDTLEEARNSSYKPYPPKNKWVTFDLKDFSKITIEMIRKAIDKNADMMLNAPTKNLGLKGIKTFSKRVKEWADYPENKFKGVTFNSFIMINQIGGTGGGAFRNMYGNFLIEASEVVKNPKLKILGEKYIEISLKWDEIGGIFMEMFNTDNRKLLNKVSSILEVIHNSELQIWQELSNI